ncbi:MAG: hypothetical protein CMH54_00920 [Myxococcales bacterium]|nr:hypothetical protein [Myxococcales bacterium]
MRKLSFHFFWLGLVFWSWACSNTSGLGPDGLDSADTDQGVVDVSGLDVPSGADVSGGIDAPQECLPMETYFACGVWEPFMGSTCFGCHQPEGPGSIGSEFKLLPVEEGNLTPNLERVQELAKKVDGNESVLLKKARGDLMHGGGAVLPVGSAEYGNLASLIAYFEDSTYCRPSCDPSFELLAEPEDICSSPPVSDQLDPSTGLAAPAIYTQRLTHWQYRGALKHVLGIYIDKIGDWLPPDSTTGAIPSNENYDLPTVEYGRYAQAAAYVADAIMGQSQDKLETLFDCSDNWNRDCAQSFIASRGMRLFRRPLSPAEVNGYLEIYDIGTEGDGTFEEGMQYVLEALLQSPDFLYQVELSAETEQGEQRLSGLEIATRLSFFLHAQPPSQVLLDAALAGELDDDTGIEEWVDTLLGDAGNARLGIQQFILRWLRMYDAEYVEKDPEKFLDFGWDEFRGLRRGAQLWAAYTVLEGDGRLETLFSAPETVVRLDSSESAFLEVSEDDVIAIPEKFGSNFGVVVALPPEERAGLLTNPARLANAHNSDDMGTRPILRGAALFKNLLCGSLEPPQAFEPPAAVEGESVKDSISYMLTSPSCAGCHKVINPLGLAFEIYDGVGRYRADKLDDLGYPIETHGAFGVDGVCSEEQESFEDAVTLVKSLAINDQLRTCATIQWFRYGLRRGPRFDGSDAGNLAEIYGAFADSDFNVRDLLKAIVLSRPFLYRDFEAAGEEP